MRVLRWVVVLAGAWPACAPDGGGAATAAGDSVIAHGDAGPGADGAGDVADGAARAASEVAPGVDVPETDAAVEVDGGPDVPAFVCADAPPDAGAGGAACGPAEAKAWDELLRGQGGWVEPSDGRAPLGPPPYDCETCLPLIDDHCTTACDCKAVSRASRPYPGAPFSCGALGNTAAHRDVPWRYWPVLVPGGAGGECVEEYSSGGGCHTFAQLYQGVDCVGGRCVLVPVARPE